MSNTNNIRKLSDLAEIKSGFAFQKAIQHTSDGTISVVQIKDLQPRLPIPWDDLTCVAESPLMQCNRLERDMILFSAKGTKNFAWHVDIQPKFAVCTSLFHSITPNTLLIDAAFLAWQINQTKAQSYIEQASAGITVKNIRIGALKALPISVPPMEIQKKVAKYAEAALNEKQILTQFIDNREKEMRAVAAGILSGQYS